ncbi:hypothetical protein P3L10_020350 [Capsicum annuum]
MVQKFSISPLIFFIITCEAILVRSELTKIPERPYLSGNPGILPQGIPFHKSQEFIENHLVNNFGSVIGDEPHFENLRKHTIMLHERPYLRDRNPRQLQRSVTFDKAVSPQLSKSPVVSPIVSKSSSTHSRDLKKNSIVLPKRPYLRRNPGILPRGIPFHKSKGFKENHSEDDVDHLIGDTTSKSYFENLKKHTILLQRPYLIRDRNHGQSQQSATFDKAISPRHSENHVVSLAVSPIFSNTNSIIQKRPYLKGNPGILPQPQGVTFPKAISPRVSKNYVISPAISKTFNTYFGE